MNETWQQRAKRAMKGRITQEQLAEKLEMTQGGVSSWLRAATQPKLEDINRIADAIGVSRVWLTHGLGYQTGPGKELLDIILSGALRDTDLDALAVTAKALTGTRFNEKRMVESAEFMPPAPTGTEKTTLLAEKLAKQK